MIKWKDSIGREWGMTYTLSHCGNYVDCTTYPPKGNYGNTVQMTIAAFKEQRIQMCDLKLT